jgi:asparagine synthase (glutamine-hydrolysing)
MCGIVGAFGPAASATSWLEQACKALRHRGPDDEGIWYDPLAGVALGHTRLAIQDLSEAGRQPMSSACGRYQLIFNGEIYNHLELRRGLGQHSWRGHSDTETLVACIAEHGIERTLRTAVGMFALAVFDAAQRRLILARDRLGEKPLYYGYAGGSLVFASELKALRSVPGFDNTLDRAALELYLRRSYVPTPLSIYAAIRKLPCGSWIELTAEHIAARVLPEPSVYWSALEVALAGEREPLAIDEPEALVMLEGVLGQAVRGQMLADVPLGAFLSGGIDSSTIVALMQAHSMMPIRTFSIGFEDEGYNEAAQARVVAQHLGTEHTELTLQARDALKLVPRMPLVYDEPFADSSQLPTFLIAQLARQHVTVALSGDGGDELFGGYNRYFLGARTWPRLSRLPLRLRRMLGGAIHALSTASWDRLATIARPLTPLRYQVETAGYKLHKVADVVASRDAREFYARLTSQRWQQPVALAPVPGDLSATPLWPSLSSLAHQMMLLDAITYLPDDILVKVDRAAMAVSLETRVPMLDHRVFEFAWRLPLHLKVRAGKGKWLLRRLLHRYVPARLVERPKMGFAVPLDRWLRTELRDWGENLLAEARLRHEGYFDAVRVRALWSDHLSGRHDRQFQLWNILMFQAWLETAR